MAAFEFTDELLNSEWIESGVDINSLPVDTIFKNILIKLHQVYTAQNIIKVVRELQRGSYSDFKKIAQERRPR